METERQGNASKSIRKLLIIRMVKITQKIQESGCQSPGEGEMGSCYLSGTEFQSWKMKRILELDGGDG